MLLTDRKNAVAALHQGVPGQMPWLKSFCPGWLAPWLAPWLTEIFTFGPSQSSQLMTCLTTVLTWK